MAQSHTSSTQQSIDPRDEEKRPSNDSRARPSFISGISGAGEAQAPRSATIGQRWSKYRPSKAMLIWSMLAAVALTMLVGFTWGGWMTSASAQSVANASAKSAVLERLAPMCVAQFNADPDKAQKLLALQEGTSYERTKYVTEQGWATLPGETKPTSQVASACADLLMQTGQ